MRGVEEGLEPPLAAEDNVFELSAAEREARGIRALPMTLGDSIEQFAESQLMQSALGEYVHQTILANKRLEWEAYRRQVTDYELGRYLPVL